MSLLIRQVELDGRTVDILCENGLITRIAPWPSALAAAEFFAGDGLTVVPGLYNGHTHAAMTLLRG
ncbi:MAG: amidohydrolase, partial [Deltaproteobacteria bacterium]|nr:amidohydrolase [Deltaproteobacteria bacterium]